MRGKIQTAVMAAAFTAVTGVALGVGLWSVAPAYAQATVALSGDWQGAYISSDGQDVNTFDVKLRQTGATLSGTVTEINVFGDKSRALFLTATLAGSVRGADVEFLKTYDGSGGASHSVRYRGRLEPGGRRVRGSYTVDGATGSFEMVR